LIYGRGYAMSLRTRLILAFLLLAVLPLTALTLFSYLSSSRALHRAVQAEAGAAAEDMRRRIDVVTAELSRGLEKMGETSVSDELARAEDGRADGERLQRLLESQIGNAARWIESLEFIPKPPETAGKADTSPDPQPDVPGPGLPVPSSARRPSRRTPPPAAPGTDAPPRRVIVLPDPPPVTGPVAAASPVPPTPPSGWPLPPELKQTIDQAARVGMRAGAEALRDVMKEIGKAREREHSQQEHRHARFVLGRDFGFILRRSGHPVGTVRANVRSQDFIQAVLDRSGHRPGEHPFAIDAEGTLYANDEDRSLLEPLQLPQAVAGTGEGRVTRRDWMIVTRKDPSSGLVLGIARPIGGMVREIRRSALLNLLAGLGLVGLALLGTLPLSRRMTRELAVLTDGAERLARGDLDVKVEVRSADELGRLAATFNRMAHDLRLHQEQLLEQERIRRELEMGRRIQAEMLPHDPLRVPFAEVTGISIPAREVAGDFFNYFVVSEAEAALIVGDVSGKGVGAALLMANLQATLRARLPLERDLSALAAALDHEIEATTRQRQYLTAFLGVLDGPAGRMRYVNAGHNAPFVLRTDGSSSLLESTGRPLGLLPGGAYEERSVALGDGDCLFLYTDGVIDTENQAGEAFGLERLRDLIVRERQGGLEGMLARVEEAVRAYRGASEPQDDATLVVLRVGQGVGYAQATRA
jgi:serine phosphatase RsbU (regulator of sigma subunit)